VGNERIAGIIGGLGPESTIEYYKRLLARYRERSGSDNAPAVVINSVDMSRMLALVTASDFAGMTEYLVAEIVRLAQAGAGCAVVSANTPHIVFDEVRKRTPIPLISIVEVTCEAARARGFRRLGLLGARFTMQGHFYQNMSGQQGIALAVPTLKEQEFIHGIYMNELVKGIIRDETRSRLEAIVTAMKQRDQIEGVILGGTELPLILREPTVSGLPVLDTTAIHVEAMVDWLLA
jgi:aspartate racemase